MKRGTEEEFGAFERNTKGFGMKMLMKMGYKPGTGLGKGGEGIVNPIEATGRVGLYGLGFEEESFLSPSSKQKTAKVVHDDRPPSPPTPPANERRGWRKKREEARKSPLSLQDAPAPVRIIDYTSPEARELSSLAEMGPRHVSLDSHRFPELRHNLKLLTDLKSREAQHARRGTHAESHTLSTLEEELQALQRNIRMLEQIQATKSSLHVLILEFLAKDEGTGVGVGREYLVKWVQRVVALTETVPHVADIVLLAEGAICGALMATLRRQFHDTLLFDASLRQWLLEVRPLCDRNLPGHLSAYTQMFTNCILSPLRALIVNSFHGDDLASEGSIAKIQDVAEVFYSWRQLIPSAIRAQLISQSILPSLHRIVDGWRVVERPSVHLHVILSPWLRCISADIGVHHQETLYPAIRRKLALWLQSLPDASSQEAAKVLSNWLPPLLPTREFDLLVGRVLLPAIQGNLSALVVNPRDQDVTPVEDALRWTTIIPSSLLAPVIAKGVFPKLMYTLHAWMTTKQANYEEITQWYQAWKGLFPETLLEHSSFQEGWRRLLLMMNSLLEDPTLPLKAFLP